jgi:oligopeptide/dipeptide ABC transporter ATP-binding protein
MTSVMRQVAERVAVMYLERIVEIGETDTLFEHARHPYTRSLISAVPIPDPVRERRRRRTVLKGELPSPSDPPAGCSFHTRCPIATARCLEIRPALAPQESDQHLAACHYPVTDIDVLVNAGRGSHAQAADVVQP